MTRFDLSGFLDTLPSRGVPPAQVALYRSAAEELLDGVEGSFDRRELEESLARAAVRGASERRLKNLRMVGDEMLGFTHSQAETLHGFGGSAGPPLVIAAAPVVARAVERVAPPVAAVERVAPPVAAVERVAPPVAAVERVAPPVAGPVDRFAPPPAAVAVAAVDIVARAPRPRASVADERAQLTKGPPPLPGCSCDVRRDTYLDDYAQDLWKMYLVVMGVIGLALSMFMPALVGVVVSLALCTLGALIAATTVGWRCEHCRRWIHRAGLDPVQRRDVWLRSLIFLGIAAVLAVALVISARSLQRQFAREKAVDRALQNLRDL